MNICYLAADFSGPGSYRCLDPGRYLAIEYGYKTFAPEVDRDKQGAFVYQLGKVLPDADIYVLQQRPEKVWLEIIPQLHSMGRIVVAETDDYYAGLPLNHPAYKVTRDLVKPLHKIYSMCDAMSVSTPFLKRAYSKLNPDITVIPNFLDWELWENLPKKDWERVRIGWMGEARMRPDDMQVLKGLIGPFLERHPEVDFVAAGDPNVHDILGIPEGQRISYPRVLFHGVPAITATMDIGLIPLAESDFNEAKSYLKGLEYAACGIPCIASPSESYRHWVEEGVNGFLARRPKDWFRHLEALVGDVDLRARLARAAKAKAQEHTIQKNIHLWHDFYERLAGDRYERLARESISRHAIQKPSEFSDFLCYAEARKPKTVVEIGSAKGGGFYALAQVAVDDALLVSIDLPFADFQGEDRKSFVGNIDRYGREGTPVETMRSYLKEGQRAEFLEMDSQDEATRATLERLLLGRKIDLLFVDGDHAYEGVRKDWELYNSLVAPEGIVAFHDILAHPKEPRSQVHRLWDEIKQDYPVREFVNLTPREDRGWGQWGGIGVIEMEAESVAA